MVIDPTAGSGVALLAAKNLNRRAYGFEIKKNFFKEANEKILPLGSPRLRLGTERVKTAKDGILFDC